MIYFYQRKNILATKISGLSIINVLNPEILVNKTMDFLRWNYSYQQNNKLFEQNRR